MRSETREICTDEGPFQHPLGYSPEGLSNEQLWLAVQPSLAGAPPVYAVTLPDPGPGTIGRLSH